MWITHTICVTLSLSFSISEKMRKQRIFTFGFLSFFVWIMVLSQEQAHADGNACDESKPIMLNCNLDYVYEYGCVWGYRRIRNSMCNDGFKYADGYSCAFFNTTEIDKTKWYELHFNGRRERRIARYLRPKHCPKQGFYSSCYPYTFWLDGEYPSKLDGYSPSEKIRGGNHFGDYYVEVEITLCPGNYFIYRFKRNFPRHFDWKLVRFIFRKEGNKTLNELSRNVSINFDKEMTSTASLREGNGQSNQIKTTSFEFTSTTSLGEGNGEFSQTKTSSVESKFTKLMSYNPLQRNTASVPYRPGTISPTQIFSSFSKSMPSTKANDSSELSPSTSVLPIESRVWIKPSTSYRFLYSNMSHYKTSAIRDIKTTQPATINTTINDALQVHFTVKLTDRSWSTNLVMNSQARNDLVKEISKNVKDLYKKDDTASFYNVTVHLFRKGSMISEFTISYKTLNSIQILKLQEHVTMTGNISKLPAQILKVSSFQVPNAPTVISTSSHSINSTAIHLKWTSVSVADLSGYQVFYKKSGSRFDRLKFASLSPSVTQAVISGLSKFTRYTFRVLASSSNGNGVASEPVTLSTDEDVPSVPPNNLQLIVYSSTRIGLVWNAIAEHQTNGILLGYNVSLTWFDKIDNQQRWNHSTATPTGGSAILLMEDLQKYTKYTFKVCGFTSKGCGPWSHYVAGTTYGDVPSQPPINITYLNFTSTSSATIQWDPIPPDHINGILRGYQVTYQITTQAESHFHQGTAFTRTTGLNDRSLKLNDLQAHSIYKVEIAGVNDVGVGAAQTIFIETCRCPKTLYTNYWTNPPYLTKNTTTNLIDGIFPNIVTQMLTWACGVCINGHEDTILNMTSNGRGMTSLKDSVVGVIDDIDEVVPQVSFPIYGNKDIQEYKGSHQYVHVVDSPGIAFITVRQSTQTFMAAIICLPLIGFVLCMTYVSGFVIWLLERNKNDEQFPKSFPKGIVDGFWWSFISITTVGYGDRFPVSKIGRLFGVCWTLIGLVTMSLLVSSLSTSLATIYMATSNEDHMIYGIKIAVIDNSTEYRVGTQKNAVISKEYRYRNIDDVHDALKNGDVKGALIDTYVAADQKDRLFEDNIRVKKLLDKKIGYGLVLSGEAQVIRKRCNDFMKRNVEEISKVIQKYTSTLEPSTESEAEERSRELFESESVMFNNASLWLGVCLLFAVICGLVWEVVLHMRRRKNNVDPACMNSRHVAERMRNEMRKTVEVFYQDIQIKTSDLRRKHRQEISKLIALKKCDQQCGTCRSCMLY